MPVKLNVKNVPTSDELEAATLANETNSKKNHKGKSDSKREKGVRVAGTRGIDVLYFQYHDQIKTLIF